MKKTIQIIFILFGLTSCKSQEVSGIWMSYNDRKIDNDIAYTTGRTAGLIIDFDKSELSLIHSDSNVVKISLDYKKMKFGILTDTLKADFRIYQKDSIEIDLFDNKMSVFHPLDLSLKLTMSKNQIMDFLINSDYEKNNTPLDIKFGKDLYFIDKQFNKAPYNHKRYALINKSWNDEGYWFVKEVQQNYFLFFTLDQTSDLHIYQISSIDECEMKLEQLQEPDWGNFKLTKLKTCL